MSKKAFICFCMDVTEDTLREAFRQGFQDPEMIKRFTSALMGPCQGKACAANFMQAVAALGGVLPETLRAPSCRPPLMPVPVSILAADAGDDWPDATH